MRNNLSAKTNFGFVSFVALHFIFLFLQFEQSNITPVSQAEDTQSNNSSKSENVFNLTSEDEEWVNKTLEHMTLYDKCAQIFMPAVFGKSLNQSSKEYKFALEMVQVHGIGGIVVSTGNVEETASMINELQKNSKIPLLVGADFENGIGMRMSSSNTFPHSMAVGSTNNFDFAYQVGKATAIEALMLGVNFNFAPVADINNNPGNPVINLRSFSEDKNQVLNFCKAYVEGSIDVGVIASAKHFPGHGNTRVDSHNELPIIRGSKKHLNENELMPFANLIENHLQSIMIGHLNVPAFEPNKDLPASLSYNIITKLLKQKMGFKGLIITDALDMKAVTNYYSTAEACVKAFLAGNDILLMPSSIQDGITAIYEAVKKSEISERRLNESVRKILCSKRWLKLDKEKFRINNNLPKRIRIEEHYKLSKTIAEESIVVFNINEKLIPLDSTKYIKTFLIDVTNRKAIIDPYFSKIYSESFPIYSSAALTSTSTNSDYQFAIDIAKDCEMIIVASYFYIRNDANGKSLSDVQLKFLEDLNALHKNIVLISFENPYILSNFPNIENYICTFSNSKASQRAALNYLNGSIEAKGKLPVTIPQTGYKIGYRWKPKY